MSTDNWLPDLMELNPSSNWNPTPPFSSTSFLEDDHSFTCGPHLTEVQEMQMYSNSDESLLQDESFGNDIFKHHFQCLNGTLFANSLNIIYTCFRNILSEWYTIFSG
jgi:hypothetical protein